MYLALVQLNTISSAHLRLQWMQIRKRAFAVQVVSFPLSKVDKFLVSIDAKEGDWITLDWMVPTEEDLELVLLVDLSTEVILRNSRLESSIDGQLWVSPELSC